MMISLSEYFNNINGRNSQTFFLRAHRDRCVHNEDLFLFYKRMKAKQLRSFLGLTESLFKGHAIEVLHSILLFSFIAKKMSLGIFIIF